MLVICIRAAVRKDDKGARKLFILFLFPPVLCELPSVTVVFIARARESYICTDTWRREGAGSIVADEYVVCCSTRTLSITDTSDWIMVLVAHWQAGA